MGLELRYGDQTVLHVADEEGYGPVRRLIFDNGFEQAELAVQPNTRFVYVMVDRPNPGDPKNLLQEELEAREADRARREGKASAPLEGVPTRVTSQPLTGTLSDGSPIEVDLERRPGPLEPSRPAEGGVQPGTDVLAYPDAPSTTSETSPFDEVEDDAFEADDTEE